MESEPNICQDQEFIANCIEWEQIASLLAIQGRWDKQLEELKEQGYLQGDIKDYDPELN